jgi:hypothetical protein
VLRLPAVGEGLRLGYQVDGSRDITPLLYLLSENSHR